MSWGEETEYVPIKGEVQAVTDKAVFLQQPNGNETWVPRSVIDGGDAVEESDCDPNIAEWFCDKEGLE